MSLGYNKAVILTYHRVPPDMAVEKFYDISFSQFKEQMKLVSERSAGPDASRIYITFDDGTDDHAAAGELLQELGLSGVFFVITGRLGQNGYLRREQVVQLARQGHLIGSHGISHRHFTRLGSSELEKELTGSKSFLEDLTGTMVDWIAPPGGVYNQTVLNRALNLGYRVFRTMDWGYSSLPLSGRADCLPVFRHYPLVTLDRMLEGNAPLWRYRLKNILKTIVGEKLYTGIRNRFTD